MISQSGRFRSAITVQLAFLVFMAQVSLRFFGEQLPAQDKSIDDDRQSEVKQLLRKQLDEGEVLYSLSTMEGGKS